jgi:CRP-like cAMP-binding protein
MTVREVSTGADIAVVGDRPTHACMIIDGFFCRYINTPDGKRQIHSFHIAGDLPDLQSIHLPVMDHNLGALMAGNVALIPHDSIRELCNGSTRIAAAFWRDTLIDAAIFREWITNVGRRTAYQRVAHLFCESFSRAKAVNLAQGDTIQFPVTQATLADATGLSLVHVNRNVQALRAAGLVSMERGLLTVLDWDGLQQAGRFDPTYLHFHYKTAA